MTAQLVTLFCQNQQSQHTATNVRYRLLAFARWLEKEHHITDLEAVTVAHILDYKAHLAKSGKAATSQARELETLRSFFRWCHGEGLIPTDPAKSVKSPRAVLNREPSYLETDEINGKRSSSMVTRIVALLILVALILTMQWLWFQWREIAPGVVSRPLGECYVDWYSQRVTLVLACPRQDLIKLWPWPVRQPWFEHGDPRERAA